jgi:hypothetical protein
MLAGPAAAVIIASGDGQANVTPPPDDFGFSNVGDAAQTAVYLGNGWVLTANHVALGPVTLRGVSYPAVPGSKTRIRKERANLPADLAVFRLQDPVPDLPPLRIRTSSPEIGAEVILMGNGRNRGEAIEVAGRPGWRWGDRESLRWGTNEVEALDVPVEVGWGSETTAFAMDFSWTDQTTHEAQVAVGDSGGGAFIKRDGSWELAGLLFAATTYDDQPASTSIYGNTTYAADLSVYRNEILALTSKPSCSDGLDGDGDGHIDHPADPSCTGPDDADEHSACADDQAPGDADGDGVATGADYEVWAQHLGSTDASIGDPSTASRSSANRSSASRSSASRTAATGDFDCSGTVDAADFRVWRANYEQSPRHGRARAPGCGGGFAIVLFVPLLISGRRGRVRAAVAHAGQHVDDQGCSG